MACSSFLLVIERRETMYSRFAQLFDSHCTNYTTNPSINLKYLKTCQKKCNDILYNDGYLFLNDVFSIIGMPGMDNIDGIGWWIDVNDRENSNFVDFGIYDRTKKTSRDFVNGLRPDIILDFNVDGNLSDYLIDLGLHLGGPDLAKEFFERQDAYKQYLDEMGYRALWES